MVPGRYGEDEVHLHMHWDTETCKNDQLDQELDRHYVHDTSKVDNLSQACPLEGSNLRGDQ